MQYKMKHDGKKLHIEAHNEDGFVRSFEIDSPAPTDEGFDQVHYSSFLKLCVDLRNEDGVNPSDIEELGKSFYVERQKYRNPVGNTAPAPEPLSKSSDTPSEESKDTDDTSGGENDSVSYHKKKATKKSTKKKSTKKSTAKKSTKKKS